MLFLRLKGCLLAITLILLANITYAAVRNNLVKNDTLSHSIGAKNPNLIYPEQQLHLRNAWYGNILLGAGLGFTGKSQTLTMQPGLDFAYDAKREQTAYLIGIGGGHSFALARAWDFRFGIEADYLNYGKSRGIVHPLVNLFPNYDTLDYSYKAKAYTVMGNFGLRWWNTGRAFIEGYSAFGVARNTLSDYQEMPSAGSTAAPVQNRFEKRSSSSPAFSVGIAFGYRIMSKMVLEMGYRYINTGNAKFKTPDVPSVSSRPILSAGKLSAHLLYFNLLFA